MSRLPLLVGAALAIACTGHPGADGESAARLDVTWSGKETGRLDAPAVASWCAVDTLLQIVAIQGDTGLGLSLFAEDTVRPTQHPVISPEIVVSWRPLGAAALRWIGDADLIGYQAISGVISVTSVDSSGVSGTLDLGFRVPGGTDTLRLAGRFTTGPVEPASGACGRFNKPVAGEGAS